MPPLKITPEDIAPFADVEPAKLAAMIADAMAMARAVAPCVIDFDFEHDEAAKAILRQAIIRWHEVDSGAVTQQSVGPFSQTVDPGVRRTGLLWPKEIQQLQKLCRGDSDTEGAWSYDTVGGPRMQHVDVCSLHLGALFCSCGAALSLGEPLWEIG